MFIECQETPNPNTLKFVINGDSLLQEYDSLTFNSIEQAKKQSTFVAELMEEDDIKTIFLTKDFMSITIKNEKNWEYLKYKFIQIITDFLNVGGNILDVKTVEEAKETIKKPEKITSESEEEQAVIDKIYEIFDERIRPAVAMDGGDILFENFKDGVVYITMHGACDGCPSAFYTLKGGIENMLKYYIPEVLEVRSFDV